jgi:hypothetical protein
VLVSSAVSQERKAQIFRKYPILSADLAMHFGRTLARDLILDVQRDRDRVVLKSQKSIKCRQKP